MKTHTLESQSSMTPRSALQILKEGHQRFVNNLKASRNLLQQVNETREGQWPFAVNHRREALSRNRRGRVLRRVDALQSG